MWMPVQLCLPTFAIATLDVIVNCVHVTEKHFCAPRFAIKVTHVQTVLKWLFLQSDEAVHMCEPYIAIDASESALTAIHHEVLCSKQWLDDCLINLGQNMLKQQHPYINGLYTICFTWTKLVLHSTR